jgi:hypothetical protein
VRPSRGAGSGRPSRRRVRVLFVPANRRGDALFVADR